MSCCLHHTLNVVLKSKAVSGIIVRNLYPTLQNNSMRARPLEIASALARPLSLSEIRQQPENLKKRQRMLSKVRDMLEKRYREDKDEDVKSSLAFTASEMHAIGSRLTDDKPLITAEDFEQRALFLFNSTGLLLRITTEIFEGKSDWLAYESSAQSGLASSFIRAGLQVDTYSAGFGFLYDPYKLDIAAAFSRDAWTTPDEPQYSSYDPDAKKFKRTFKTDADKEFTITDYARYTPKKFGAPWTVDFPERTPAAFMYKASTIPAYARKEPKDSDVFTMVMKERNYNEVIIKPKPGGTLADAIIGIVDVKNLYSLRDFTVQASLKRIKFYLKKDLPLLLYENHTLTHLSDVVPESEIIGRDLEPIGTSEIPLYSRKRYEKTHNINSALSALTFDGISTAFFPNYTDGGYEDGLMTIYRYYDGHNMVGKTFDTEQVIQVLAGLITAKSYLNVDLNIDLHHKMPRVFDILTPEYYMYVLEGRVYVVPTMFFNICFRMYYEDGEENTTTETIKKLVPGVRPNANRQYFMLSAFKRVAQPFIRPDLVPEPGMMYLLASENPDWKKQKGRILSILSGNPPGSLKLGGGRRHHLYLKFIKQV